MGERNGLAGRVAAHVAARRLFPDPGTALLAVSGGRDSVALLDLMACVADGRGLRLAVAHVDHGIAPESGAVAQRVAALAADYGVPCDVRTLALGGGTSETVARRARYAALREMQREAGARYLVTAHHADDQAETVLYRVLRGSGPAGLAGIPAQGPGGLVRPLLPFRRRELGDWLGRLTAHRSPLTSYDDPANRDPRHDRSWLRVAVVPLLVERFGDAVVRRLGDVAHHAARERRAWAAVLHALPELGLRRVGPGVEVARAPLVGYDKMLSEVILRALAREVGLVLGPARAAALAGFVGTGASGRRLELGRGWTAELAFDRVRIVPRTHPEPPPVLLGDRHAGAARWGAWEFAWRREQAGMPSREAFVTWVPEGAARVRALAPGDRLVPLGGVGRRKVRRLLMEARVPAGARAVYPVVVSGDDAVVWVPGVCRAAADVPPPGEPALRIEARAAPGD